MAFDNFIADRFIAEFDRGLRTLAGIHEARRAAPAAGVSEAALDDAQKAHAAALMRVNHSGEVCAQALYQGQALAARGEPLQASLRKAAEEEIDHLAWCRERIEELGGRTSVLDPLWYAGSLAIGLLAGRCGNEWNLGFLAETEKQVEEHLEGHLKRLSADDARTRATLRAMRDDEAGHARLARELGARELPQPVRLAMRGAARVMTTVSYRI